MSKIVLISGATSGIGEATARLLAQHNYDLIICGRREDRLGALEKELAKRCRIHKLRFDVRDRQAVDQAIRSLPPDWQNIEVLINNAGNAHGMAPVDQGDIDDWDAMIDINVKGLLYLSRAIIPRMVTRKSGHIVNIGSIAGREVYPSGSVYCASKFAVDALNTGMRMDLFKHGIKVSTVNPGLVETEFSLVRFKGDKARAGNAYKGLIPLTGEDIAEAIFFILSRPAHVNINEIHLLPSDQAAATMVNRQS